jgi:phenylacetate-CoA ligase
MTEYYDPASETMPQAERAVYYEEKVREIVHAAYESSPFMRDHFDKAGLAPGDIRGPRDLPKAPIVKKAAIREAHKLFPPFGNLMRIDWPQLQRIYVSPGPMYGPEPVGERRPKEVKALYSMGFRKGDRVTVTLSYHLVPAGLLFDTALRELGAIVIPTGVGNAELQVGVMRDLQVTGYIGTATFLMNLIKKAEAMGLSFGKEVVLKKTLLTAEKVPKTLRRAFEENYGIHTAEGYGTAEAGLFAYECSEKSGMHIAEEVFVEIVDPDTGEPVPEGETGEIVVTHFSSAFPLIRFGTGDLSYLRTEPCPCGRTSDRLGEIVGRVGDSYKARGMFIHEPQVRAVLEKVREVSRGALVITRENERDKLTFKVELKDEQIDKKEVRKSLEEAFKDLCRLKVDDVEFCSKGTMRAEEKALLDEREWD